MTLSVIFFKFKGIKIHFILQSQIFLTPTKVVVLSKVLPKLSVLQSADQEI